MFMTSIKLSLLLFMILIVNDHVDVPITSSKANVQKTKTRDDEKQITSISELLKEISLEQYIEVFAKEMIDLQMLLNLKP